MKRLKINLDMLGYAFDHGGWQTSHFLDTETGEIVQVNEDTRRMLDDLNEMYSGDDNLLNDLDGLVTRRGLRDTVKNDLKMAYQIEQGYGTRYLKIPDTDSLEGYADMKAFIETVGDTEFRERLWNALRGQGAPQHFRETLANENPVEEKRWLVFKAEQMNQRVLSWLASEGIEVEG